MSGGKKSVLILLIVVVALGVWRVYKHPRSLSCQLEALQEKENIVPIAILGSGPAGLSAALYGARARIKTVVFRGKHPGGQLTGTTDVENWPSIEHIQGPELIKRLEQHASQHGAVFVPEAIASVDASQWPFALTTETGKRINALSVIVATGATPRKLGIPGEQEYWGKGVTTCAICDAPYYKDKSVIVIGGGDSAVEEALQLSAYAKKVSVLVRRGQMRASQAMQERLARVSQVTVEYFSQLISIAGDGDHVNRVVIDHSDTKTSEERSIDGVFLAIGHVPNTDSLDARLERSYDGYLALQGRTQQTSVPGIYGAGDIEDFRYRQAGVASGSGIKAALDATQFLAHVGFDSDQQERYGDQLFDETELNMQPLISLESLAQTQQFLKAHRYALIDFYTTTCPSCLQMMPVIEWASAQLAGAIGCAKIDARAAQEVAKHYQVYEVPTMLIFKDGVLTDRHREVMDRKELLSYLKKVGGSFKD